MNTTGRIFTLTSFGESHGPAMGGIIDGMPAGVTISLDRLQHEVARRRPGQPLATTRQESDEVEILSGLKDGITLGTPIGFVVRNTDARSSDYDDLEHVFRPSHADFTYQAKYGIRDHRGGGRASARETIARVVAGAFARQALETLGIEIVAYTSQIGQIKLSQDYNDLDLARVDATAVRCPDLDIAATMTAAIDQARDEKDSLGGVVTCVVKGVPAGLGEPLFGKLHAQLAQAMMSIPAAKGFEIGDGFDITAKRGSQVLDKFVVNDGKITTATNHSGGIQGGISNGNDICFRVAFKPVATLMRDINTVSDSGVPITIHPTGRHDVCVVPRAVPIVEAMTAIVLLDNYLLNRASRL